MNQPPTPRETNPVLPHSRALRNASVADRRRMIKAIVGSVPVVLTVVGTAQANQGSAYPGGKTL